MNSIALEDLIKKIEQGSASEALARGVDFKSSWQQAHGKDISAIANQNAGGHGWIIVGVDDGGKLLGRDQSWLKKEEELVSNHILQYLSPTWVVSETVGHQLAGGFVLFLKIINPGEVVTWNGRAYKLSGTLSQEMKPEEELALSMRLPGEDYSKQPWSGTIDGALVLDFAKKIHAENKDIDETFSDLDHLSPAEVLSKLQINNTIASGILFGDYPVRVVHYDTNEDILDQQERSGAYHLLSDTFIEHIQSWTRKQGTVIRGQSTSSAEEVPYPVKALREVLANAVAHALYARDKGHLVIELRPNRLTIQNNCSLDSRVFVNKWFSKDSNVKNKLLMTALRVAKITDELGSGKNRIFRQMIESGRREPIVEFTEQNRHGRWAVTLYNEESNTNLQSLIRRLQESAPSPDYWRIATALVLWRDYTWSEVQKRLDGHYNRIAIGVLRSAMSPVIIVNDRLFLKRWAQVALSGQISRRFTTPEEEQIQLILKSFAFDSGRSGDITTEEARRIIGLSATQSETVQLSNLFRKWADQHAIKMVKRGHWRFLTESGKNTEIIMSLFQPSSEEPSKT